MLGIIIIQIKPLVFVPIALALRKVSHSLPVCLPACLPVCPEEFCTILSNYMCHCRLFH